MGREWNADKGRIRRIFADGIGAVLRARSGPHLSEISAWARRRVARSLFGRAQEWIPGRAASIDEAASHSSLITNQTVRL
jgi:hypothetical protein